jgi:alkylation response protein AidB-like acyl-CoA dehydrogenase
MKAIFQVTKMRSDRAGLLEAVNDILPSIQDEALERDAEVAFPHASFARLIELGLLTATLPENLGGLAFGYGDAGADALLKLFMLLGEGSLAVARLYEAHVNALQLILRYGSEPLAAQTARDAAQKHIFALWVTDPPGKELRLEPDGNGFVLSGIKDFCSGAGAATRALITAADATGTRMLAVRLEPETRVLPSRIKLGGMRAAVTGSVDFSGMVVAESALIGKAGDYLKEPVFSAGAWRGSAAALGGLAALLNLHRDGIRQRHREHDPHQQARFGQAVIAYETSRLWMVQAARLACLEEHTPEAIIAYVNLARLAVEAACLEALQLAQRSLGLFGFIAGSKAELLYRDLATYLRQPAPDETLTKAASYYFASGLAWR